MAKFFAISGGQLSGKTTLCHRIVSDLKIEGVNVGYSEEAVRSSYLMIKNQRNEKMHLESLLIHIQREILASEYYDVVICDRSALDYLAFANLRFPGASSCIYLQSVKALVSNYSKIYSKVFVTNEFLGVDAGDPARKGENTKPEDVSLEIARLCQSYDVPWCFIGGYQKEERKRHPLIDTILTGL